MTDSCSSKPHAKPNRLGFNIQRCRPCLNSQVDVHLSEHRFEANEAALTNRIFHADANFELLHAG
jgi:hypothetical protein